MFWTAVASSTLSTTPESSAGLASAAPSYQQQHTKPVALRALASSWQLSNAAFKSRQLHQQHKEQLRLQSQPLSPPKEQAEQTGGVLEAEQETEKHQTAGPSLKKKIRPKSESKIFKAFTSCKCTKKEKN
ncbi:uncharacterized protein [Drosophila bipectinata]|uniref:uncharacterized protein n=1 Tax=Drosophila bipectinata TaxID=42026 RepID=UPI001C89A8BB|nr:uncharacterized protein LOC108130474 [Drosophila bipectinata]